MDPLLAAFSLFYSLIKKESQASVFAYLLTSLSPELDPARVLSWDGKAPCSAISWEAFRCWQSGCLGRSYSRTQVPSFNCWKPNDWHLQKEPTEKSLSTNSYQWPSPMTGSLPTSPSMCQCARPWVQYVHTLAYGTYEIGVSKLILWILKLQKFVKTQSGKVKYLNPALLLSQLLSHCHKLTSPVLWTMLPSSSHIFKSVRVEISAIYGNRYIAVSI